MTRAALFALTGLGQFAYWLLADHSREGQGEWPQVLAFSLTIAMLAVAVPLFAQLVGGQIALRAALVASSGATLSSAANILEDGLKMEWAFFAFIAGLLITYVGLAALTFAIVRRAGQRRFALVPVGTTAALLVYPPAGGPVMLATWLLAGAFALARASAQTEAAPASG